MKGQQQEVTLGLTWEESRVRPFPFQLTAQTHSHLGRFSAYVGLERIIHKRMLRSVIGDNKREEVIMPRRQQISLGIWGIGDNIRVEVGLLQPCVANATIGAEEVTQEEVDDCLTTLHFVPLPGACCLLRLQCCYQISVRNRAGQDKADKELRGVMIVLETIIHLRDGTGPPSPFYTF
ncbi:hypothetical protein DFJ73DRAFT_30532 [Zopfochytrium polystomum]|nr:hypothetical protein DFJ73DRAFT_30532 [Zopfochytrium polystomum]